MGEADLIQEEGTGLPQCDRRRCGQARGPLRRGGSAVLGGVRKEVEETFPASVRLQVIRPGGRKSIHGGVQAEAGCSW